ncbi:DUF87 domain-containing protein [Thermoplasmatales archaeon AK]|nr:DUF87 domain-containing protein [Thermoplasmatales archaeon AK]
MRESSELIRKIKIRKRFEIEENSKVRMCLVDSKYDGGPLYLQLLEGLKSGVAIKVLLSNVSGESGYSFLDRLRKERSADLRFYGDKMLSSSSALSGQIRAIEALQTRIKETGRNLKLMRFELVLFRSHPVNLSQTFTNITRIARFIGLFFRPMVPRRSVIKRFQPLEMHPKCPIYPLDTRSLSEILPLYFSGFPATSGILIGVEEVGNSPVFLNIFESPSFNSLVIGETGSGKSFFVKLLVLRMLYSFSDTGFFVFDPLNEYNKLLMAAQSEKLSGRGNTFHVLGGESGWNSSLTDLMERIYTLMSEDPDRKKIIVLEECHMIMGDPQASKILETVVRHSRHYSTAIISISQNVDDFTAARNSSIALNSFNIFLFRTRKLLEKDKKPLKVDGYDNVTPELLLGGRNMPYSECYYANGDVCIKTRIIPTNEERLIG